MAQRYAGTRRQTSVRWSNLGWHFAGDRHLAGWRSLNCTNDQLAASANLCLSGLVIAQERRDQIEVDLGLIAADVVPRVRDPLEAHVSPPPGLCLALPFPA